LNANGVSTTDPQAAIDGIIQVAGQATESRLTPQRAENLQVENWSAVFH